MPLDVSLVAEIDGRIIGCILARIEYLGIPSTEVCVIHSIVVEYDYRQRGIGERLVNELCSRCRTEGINTVRAVIDEENTELLRFAEHLGFRRSSILNYDKTLESG